MHNVLSNDTSGDFFSQLLAIRRNGEITEFTLSFIPRSAGRLNHSRYCRPKVFSFAHVGCVHGKESLCREKFKAQGFFCMCYGIVESIP